MGVLRVHGEEGVGGDEVGIEAGLEEDAVELEGEGEGARGGRAGFDEGREEGGGAVEAMRVELLIEHQGIFLE